MQCICPFLIDNLFKASNLCSNVKMSLLSRVI